MIAKLIGVVVAVIIFIVVIFPIVNNFTSEIEGASPEAVTVVQLFPLIIAIMVVVVILPIVGLGGDYEITPEHEDYEEYESYVEEEKVTRKSAMRILRERYANGEISSEEYTEKMSRL